MRADAVPKLGPSPRRPRVAPGTIRFLQTRLGVFLPYPSAPPHGVRNSGRKKGPTERELQRPKKKKGPRKTGVGRATATTTLSFYILHPYYVCYCRSIGAYF